MSRLPVGLTIATLVYPAPAWIPSKVAPSLTSQQNVLPALSLALGWAARTG